jgi:histidyl-tRNA synthetase
MYTVGCSFGIERIFTILEARQDEKKKTITNTRCYVTFFKDRVDDKKNTELFEHVLKITKELWDVGIATEFVSDRNAIMKVQVIDALAKGIPYMIQIGETELKENMVVFKDLVANARPEKISRHEIVPLIKHKLAPGI